MSCLGRFGGGGYRLVNRRTCLMTNVRPLLFLEGGASKVTTTPVSSFRLLSVSAVSRADQNQAVATAAASVVNDSSSTVEAAQAVIQTAADGAQVLADPSFPMLGLAHAYPSGWIQAIMEVLHVDFGLSWCATIATSTVLLRIMVFPLMVKQRRAAVKSNNILPQIQRIQKELQSVTDKDEQLRLTKEFQQVYKRQGITPLTPLAPIFFNGFAFTSMFFGIRGMANAPVPSMTTGGLGWFTDLTVSDPIFLLPVMTASTLALSLHLNADGLDTAAMPPWMPTFFKIMPWISLPVMMQFPAALNLYWLTNNVITLCQASMLKQKSVRQRLGIGEMIVWKKEDLPMINDGPFGFGMKNNSIEERIKKEQAKEDQRRRSQSDSAE